MSLPALNRPALSVVPDHAEERVVDADVYRSVFRRHAAGVVVITADAGHGPAGFAATSLVSISLLPPLVSFAIATSASSWPTVSTANSLVINGQTDIIIVGLVAYGVLGLLSDAVVRQIQRRALSWRRTLAS
jgi:hypothetical protein